MDKMKVKLNVKIPSWMGEYRYEEVERMLCTLIHHREEAFFFGFGFVVWCVDCSDIWMVSPQ